MSDYIVNPVEKVSEFTYRLALRIFWVGTVKKAPCTFVIREREQHKNFHIEATLMSPFFLNQIFQLILGPLGANICSINYSMLHYFEGFPEAHTQTDE